MNSPAPDSRREPMSWKRTACDKGGSSTAGVGQRCGVPPDSADWANGTSGHANVRPRRFRAPRLAKALQRLCHGRLDTTCHAGNIDLAATGYLTRDRGRCVVLMMQEAVQVPPRVQSDTGE